MAVLPNEIVRKILQISDGDDIGRCRRVCRQWRDVADSLGDDIWKRECVKINEKAHEQTSLTWKEFYKSMSLWSRVNSSRVRNNWNVCSGSILNRPIVLQFQVLNDGTVGCPYNTDFDLFYANYNCIQYYDLKYHCFSEDARFFDYIFEDYAENDKLIVLKDDVSDLHVITKANNQDKVVGELGYNSEFFLFENCIYFKDNDDMICVAQLKEENGNVSVETTRLCNFETDIISISYINTGHVNFLTDKCEIFSLIGTEIEKIHAFTRTANRNDIVKTLTRHGFDWSDPSIYKWLTHKGWSNGPFVEIVKFKNATVFKHGKVILVGTCRRVLHIYYNPYGVYGDLKLNNAKPMKTIDLNIVYPVSERYKVRKIEQFDVKETGNGHQIIIKYCQRLVVLELTHDDEDPKEPNDMMMDYDEDFLYDQELRRGTSGSESTGEFSLGAESKRGMSERVNNDGTLSLDTELKMGAPGSKTNNDVESLEAEYKKASESEDEGQPLKKAKL